MSTRSDQGLGVQSYLQAIMDAAQSDGADIRGYFAWCAQLHLALGCVEAVLLAITYKWRAGSMHGSRIVTDIICQQRRADHVAV